MNCKELINYLCGFDPNEEVPVVILDLKTRTGYIAEHYQTFDEAPMLLFEMGEPMPMDDMVKEVRE